MKRLLLLSVGAIVALQMILTPYSSARPLESEGSTRAVWARYFENFSGSFISIRAYDDAAPSSISATWTEGEETEGGTLQRIIDGGQYLRHMGTFPVDERPDFVTVRRNDDNWSRVEVEDWAEPPASRSDSYQQGFHSHYPDAVEIADRMADLAAEFPSLTSLVDLPHVTNGYQRKAQVILGAHPTGTWSSLVGLDQNKGIVITSNAYGHAGGNSVKVSLVDPETVDSPLSVSVLGSSIRVNLGTDSEGGISSTAAEVVAAINGSGVASALVSATTYRGNGGSGNPVPTSGEIQLTDNLMAPVSVPRGPQRMPMLRIGAHRDGSRVGVLVAAGLAGRSWAAQLTAIEFAEQLLRNYATDPEIKSLVDNLEIFVVPVINPDGDLYSHYDNAAQRKNLTSYCLATGQGDPASRNIWGVDLNRNFSVGSIFDGYNGGETACTSETYSGPFEASEPETKNMMWVPSTFPNIKFSADLGSYGGYIGYPPGAYISSGRQLLPMPSAGDIQFFEHMAARFASSTARSRGNVILPQNVGIKTDTILQSSAGNLGDYLYYEHGIMSQMVTVGIPRHSSGTGWVDVGFWPDFNGEGLPSAVEFTDGLIGMLGVAQEYAEDTTPPDAKLTPEPGIYGPSVDLWFESDEPSSIYYTLDGSTPNTSSTQWAPTDAQVGIYEPIELSETTTVRWIAQDFKGNISAVKSATFELREEEFLLAADPERIDFGSREVGSGAETKSVEITNQGWGTAEIDEIDLDFDSGSDPASFALADNGCEGASLAADKSCEIEVIFSPVSAGNQAATLTLRGEGGAAEASVELAATVVAKPPEIPGPPGEPKPPAPKPPVLPAQLLVKASGDTRCIGNPHLARTKRDLRALIELAGEGKVSLKLQRRLPARARQPKVCPSQVGNPKRRPTFRNRVPVRVGKGKVVKKRFATELNLGEGSHKIAVLRTLGARRLATGHYRVWLVVRDRDGRRSGEAALHFRVLRR